MIVDNLDKFEQFCEFLSQEPFMAFDTETDNLHGDIVGMSFAKSSSKGWYIPIAHAPNFVDGDRNIPKEKVIELMKPIFEAKHTQWLCWNLQYEYYTLRHWLGIEMATGEDAQIMYWLLNSEGNLRLKHRAVVDLGLSGATTYEDMAKGKSPMYSPVDECGEYAIQDARFTWELYWKYLPLLKVKGNCYNVYKGIHLPLVVVLDSMFERGIRIDRQALNEVKIYCQTSMLSLAEEMYSVAKRYFNPNSGSQVRDLFVNQLKLPVISWTKGGKSGNSQPSVDQNALSHYAKEAEGEASLLAKKVLAYRELGKILSTYTDSILQKADHSDRIHSSFNQTGTVGGRFSSRNPNFQNIPARSEVGKAIRKVFIAREGYKLVCADFSQLELRILAHFTKDPILCEAFATGKDPHSATAAMLMSMPYEEFFSAYKKQKAKDKEIVELWLAEYGFTPEDMRGRSKTVNFGIAYGKNTDLDLGITKDFLDQWKSIHKVVVKYIQGEHKQLLNQGFVNTVLGRFRHSEKVFSPSWEEREAALRELFNTKIQGTAADLANMSMIMIHGEFQTRGLDAFLIAQVHDEIIAEAREQQAQEVSDIMKHCMETCYPLSIVLEVEPGIGNNWVEAKG